VERKRTAGPALVLATNDLETSAQIIAERYKARWDELFLQMAEAKPERIRSFSSPATKMPSSGDIYWL